MKENQIVVYQPNETVRLEVELRDESIWLPQQKIADLFGVQKAAISKHLKNIFEAGELQEDCVPAVIVLRKRILSKDGSLAKARVLTFREKWRRRRRRFYARNGDRLWGDGGGSFRLNRVCVSAICGSR